MLVAWPKRGSPAFQIWCKAFGASERPVTLYVRSLTFPSNNLAIARGGKKRHKEKTSLKGGTAGSRELGYTVWRTTASFAATLAEGSVSWRLSFSVVKGRKVARARKVKGRIP